MVTKHSIFISSLHIFLVSIILLAGCQSTASNKAESDHPDYEILSSTVTANFAPDGRLWRLVPTEETVYVDYSDDSGKSYSLPVAINKHTQQISAWPENPPAIEISHSGRISVLYYADEEQKSTSYYSYSDDNGQTFSTPTLISDHAKTAMHYMDKMLIDEDGQMYLFWHDTRHDAHQAEHKHDLGSGILSLYYSVKSPSDKSQFSNHFLSSGICSCCRTATTLSANGKPVILARMVYDNGVRDHSLIKMNPDGTWKKPQRVTYDNWSIQACPEHGPALAIDNKNRTHLTWFTLGDERQGIFYAQTDDDGKTVSKPMALGNIDHLPSHPDVITLNQRVVIVWKEFDGEQTSLHIKESADRGKTWQDKTTGLSTESKNSHPKLISNKKDIFLSWTSKDKGHLVTKI